MGKRRTFFFTGLGVSGGVALGPAYLVEPQGVETESRIIPAEEIDHEIERFARAVEMAREEVRDLGRTVAQRLDANQAAIFDAHLFLLEDPLLIDRTIQRVRETARNSEYIFWSLTREIGDQLQSLGDSYFSERSHDLYDVARRVLKFLNELNEPEGIGLPSGSIVIANDLGPGETAQFHKDAIAGLCTNTGGPTSHTAIMAKALSLPAVVGLDFLTHYVRTGDFLIVDGTEGKVILNPAPDQIEYYKERAEEYRQTRSQLLQISSLPAETQDGQLVSLNANIEFTTEVDFALIQGADGIGLYRTEYLYIERRTLPTEEEQEADYAAVLEAMGDRPVVFRTLDVGGDKIATTVPHSKEANPFLGLRALRLCLAHVDLFRSQLRPMMRAARGKELHLLLPMVSGVEEIIQARLIINEVYGDLEDAGEELPERILIGAMIEIPSAALQAEVLAREVDFFSIGTNDLVQYTLAVDRVNKMVGYLYQETHPAILQLIHHVADVSRRTGTPLSVCGEMAGDPRLALLLIGLGVRSLSMSPGLIGPVKQAVRSARLSELEEMAKHLLTLGSPGEVRAALARMLAPVALFSSDEVPRAI